MYCFCWLALKNFFYPTKIYLLKSATACKPNGGGGIVEYRTWSQCAGLKSHQQMLPWCPVRFSSPDTKTRSCSSKSPAFTLQTYALCQNGSLWCWQASLTQDIVLTNSVPPIDPISWIVCCCYYLWYVCQCRLPSPHIQSFRKYSDPLNFSTLCYVTAFF